MSRPRGSRCGIGRSSSAAGTTIESMHQGQRDAALGRDRLQERQTRFVQNILMSRSIVRRGGAAGMNRIVGGSAGAGRYMRDSGWGCPLRRRIRPVPTSLEILMNVSVHMAIFYLPACWDGVP